MPGIALLVLVLLAILLTGVKTIPQGNVGVTTVFGKYRRVLRPGLSFVIPLIEKVTKRISIQNRSLDLQFQAITQDQANVYFKAMLLYSVLNEDEATINNVAFKFLSENDLMVALVRTVEGSVRGFVATRPQTQILALRGEIVAEVKHQLDAQLETWGYHLQDLQLNDITFDTAITESMARVVASSNLRAAATNEGEAEMIRRTKAAEAEGAAIRISAEAERQASQLRGEGVALFRREVSRGLAEAEATADPALVQLSIWTETLRHLAEYGRGNVMFFDGSVNGMQDSMRQLAALHQLDRPDVTRPTAGAEQTMPRPALPRPAQPR
jgi:prepilin-type processing-associated H-X9-DG protein